MNGLVSIITPVYNSEKFIKQCIVSVQSQTYKNWELILIDDGSTDQTSKIVKLFLNDTRIKYIKLRKNLGAAKARNVGIEEANGEYIAFLDSDDLWSPNKLEKQINFMKENGHDFTFTYYNKIDEEGLSLGETVKNSEVITYNKLLRECPGNSTIIYNCKSLGKNYVPDIKKRNDYLMWFTILNKTNAIYGLLEVLSSHRVVKGSLSSNKSDLIKYHWRIYRKYEKLNIFKSMYLIIYWVLKTIF